RRRVGGVRPARARTGPAHPAPYAARWGSPAGPVRLAPVRRTDARRAVGAAGRGVGVAGVEHDPRAVEDDPRPVKIFDQVLAPLSNKQREQVEAAYALLEHGSEPVHRQHLPALDDATARSCLEQLLRRTGRTLVALDGGVRWTSGYDDAIRSELTDAGWQPLAEIDRAVLTLVLVHSVAIPRSEEQLHTDAWTSPHPTSAEEILRRSKLPATEARL